MDQKFIDILNDIKPEIMEYTGSDLIDDSVIDSMDIMRLIAGCEEAFDIDFDPDDIDPDNFVSVDSIWQLVSKIIEN
jgi:acyl carrier protein